MAKQNVWQALLRVQAGMAGVRPQSRGSKGNLYIDLDLLLSKARPLCQAAGLVIVHDINLHEASELMIVRSGVVLANDSPHAESGVWVNVPVGPQNPGVTRDEAASGVIHWAPHAIASAFTYGRRIGLCALLAVSERDDDAAIAQAAVQQASVQAAVKAAPAPASNAELRAAAVVSLIASGKALALIGDSAPDVPGKRNIGAVRQMVGEFQGLEAGIPAELLACTTADLQAAAGHWAAKAEKANQVPL